ncbi:MAG: hemolysin family protein [Oscillospiraceae bacterium]|nr:hemolysin family protein [Oscillospiraceae bacterium]
MLGDDPLLWQLLLQLFLITMNAIFVCAEIAVISMNDAKLERLSKENNKQARRLLSLTSQPAKFLATIQVGTTFAGFLASAFAAASFAARLTGWFESFGSPLPTGALNNISVVVITLILSYVTIVLGELVPKRIAMKNAEAIGLGMSGLIYTLSKLFGPVVLLLTASTNAVLRLLGIDPNAEVEKVTEEEIRIMVDAGSEKGAIDLEEKEFIHNLFDFDDITVDKIMTHRTDVAMLWMEESDEEWQKTIYEHRHSIYPICEDDQDNIVGVLNIKDYFRLSDRGRESTMAGAVKPPQFVPESLRADTLLRNMKKNRNHFAVILDEYGGMSGVITMTDLLEQLVGDLDDDNQPDEPPLIEQLDAGIWRVSGAAPLDEVAKAVDIPLPYDEYDTFAGLVLSLLDSIPEDGSTPEMEEFGLRIRIDLIQDHRIETATISKIESTQAQ